MFTSPDVRYHLKDAVARWLASIDDPSEGELDLILSLDKPGEKMPPLVRLALYPQAVWFPILQRRELLPAWLESPNEERRSDALNVLRNASVKFPADVADILRRWWSKDATRAKELLRWFAWLIEAGSCPDLLALNLDLIRSKPPGLFDSGRRFDRLSLAAWIKKSPEAAGEILRVWFEMWFETFPDDHPFKREHQNDNDNYWLKELVMKSPVAFLDAAIPAFIETIRRIKQSEDTQGKTEFTWYWRLERANHGSQSFLAFVRSGLAAVASSNPGKAQTYLQQIDPASHSAVLYLHLETIASNGKALGNILVSLLGESEVFQAGPNNTRWLSFARAAKAALPHLGHLGRAAVEARLLSYWDELDHAKRLARDSISSQGEEKVNNRRGAIQYLNDNGYEQWCILKTIGQDHLSSSANIRLALLERKFEGRSLPEPSSLGGVLVPPPIEADRTKFMTDAQWLRAIRKYKDDRESKRRGLPWFHHTGATGLAQLLKERTKEDPARYLQLLFRLPANTAKKYSEEILLGLAESQASQETLLSAILYAHSQINQPFCYAICRIFECHPRLADNDQAFRILAWYVECGNVATEGASEESRIEQEIVNIDHLTERGGALKLRGSYADRGAAAEALGAVIWQCPSRLQDAIDILSRRVIDEHVLSIRCCLTRSIYSVLRYDNRRAAELLKRLVIRPQGVELVPLTTHEGFNALSYILRGAPEIGIELVDLLLRSSNEDQKLIGAFHLFREAFYNSVLTERADALINLSDGHRNLAAHVAATHFRYAEYRSRAESQLMAFFDDPAKGVRAAAADCFRDLQSGDLHFCRGLLRMFIKSKAFEEENFPFFYFLKEACDQTFEEVVLASERLVKLIEENIKQATADIDLHYLDELIRREYAAVANQPELRRRLLDVIDRMLELGLYGTEQIIQEHERI